MKYIEDKHQTLVDLIYERLQDSHPNGLVLKNIEYKLSDGRYGECDILMVELFRDNKYAYVFEVKSMNSYRARNKAYYQLSKDNKYVLEMFNIERVFDFYVYGHNDDGYKIELVKKEKIKEKEKKFS